MGWREDFMFMLDAADLHLHEFWLHSCVFELRRIRHSVSIMNRVGSLVNYMKNVSEHLVTEAEWIHTDSEANKTALMKFFRECFQEELRPIQ